jgi:hypothetical protein
MILDLAGSLLLHLNVIQLANLRSIIWVCQVVAKYLDRILNLITVLPLSKVNQFKTQYV